MLPYPLLQGSIASEEAKQLQTAINTMKVSADQYRAELACSGLQLGSLIQVCFFFIYIQCHSVSSFLVIPPSDLRCLLPPLSPTATTGGADISTDIQMEETRKYAVCNKLW